MILKVKKTFYFLISLLALTLFIFPVKKVLALEITYPSLLGFSINSSSTLPEYAKYFFNFGMALAGALAVIVIAFGGILFLIDYGKGKFQSEGKEWLKSGIIGLIILLSSYLIIYTINPDLVVFKVEKLFPISIGFPWPGNPYFDDTPTADYQELPIGILTENLLTRTMECYDFDSAGNPVEGEEIKTDDNKKMAGPTYLNHDRADCFLKLADAIQKKSKIASDLSDEITKLMKTCSCEKYGHCGTKCKTTIDDTTKSPFGCRPIDATKTCSGDCTRKAALGCIMPLGTTDADSCCPADVKEKIEHGKISVGISPGSGGCGNTPKDYYGLDEFRCPNPIKGAPHKECDGSEDFIENKVKVNKKEITVIDIKKWNQLNLYQQLQYYAHAIEAIRFEINNDLDDLNSATKKLADCSATNMELSSVDMLHIQEGTDKADKKINVKLSSATIPGAKEQKWCKGFNYSNSSCFETCQNMCPDISQNNKDALKSYGKCDKCDPSDAGCLQTQQDCINQKFDAKKCIFSKTGGDFNTCVKTCQNDCLNNCSKVYLACSDEFKNCQEQCNQNSKCILDNKGKCLTDSGFFQFSGNQNNDYANLKNFIDNSYTCEKGSLQIAGYPDCINSNFSKTNYSASFLFQNPNYQQCPKPYEPNPNNLYCFDPKSPKTACLDMCPAQIKCPTASQCPECPCNKIDKTFTFDIPKTRDSANGTTVEPDEKVNKTIKEFQIVGPECSEFTYNSDPLTFYCRVNWEPQAPLTGKYFQGVPGQGGLEIPVGQTIDDAKKWANDFLKSADKIKEHLKDLGDQFKKITDAKKYCRCDSKYDADNKDKAKAGKPICSTDCAYNKPAVPGEKGTCSFVPCTGSSCQQMMDYLFEVSNYYRQLKTDYIDLYVYMLKEGRSDVLKKLDYSRDSMNFCSQQSTGLGESAYRTFSCTKAYEHTTTLPTRCYGILDGQVQAPPVDQTDNWFCTKTLIK